MKFHLRTIVLNNAPLKVISLILGYALWNGFSNQRIVEQEFKVPVCFYGEDAASEIDAPPTMHITLRGKRNNIRKLDTNTLAVHIDSDDLTHGSQEITLDESHLLLPEHIKLVDYVPSNLVITKQHNSPIYS